MDFSERNEYLAAEWRTSLTDEERQEYNSRASTANVVPRRDVIKRTLKRIKREVTSNLKLKLNYNCKNINRIVLLYSLTCDVDGFHIQRRTPGPPLPPNLRSFPSGVKLLVSVTFAGNSLDCIFLTSLISVHVT